MSDLDIMVDKVPDQLPARMINEFCYCPRLFYLEYVQGEWAHNSDTLEGRYVHRRVDKGGGEMPEPEEVEPDAIQARSVMVGSAELGALAVVDLVESDDGGVVPVDYKKGAPPDLPERAWEPERVQVCLQGLLLRENGYRTDGGVLYFSATKQRVDVPFTNELIARTKELLREAREVAARGVIPPPLVSSNKCVRCSLAGICLPDEINLLRETTRSRPDEPPDVQPLLGEVESAAETMADIAWRQGLPVPGKVGDSEPKERSKPAKVAKVGSAEVGEVRRLLAGRSDKIPVYIRGHGSSLGLRGDELEVRDKGTVVTRIRLNDISQLNVFGAVQMTAQAMKQLMGREIPIIHLSYGGWLTGVTTSPPHKNIELRRRQYELASNEIFCLTLARRITQGKVRNCRTLLRRNGREVPERALHELKMAVKNCDRVENLGALLGVEGYAARTYFENFPLMLRSGEKEEGICFDWNGRNRRPPKDPINALLSYVYALLSKEALIAVLAVGFDPYLGFYHQPRYGRPALALDLMEEFRPLVGDSVVLQVINRGAVKADDFVYRAGGCNLTEKGKHAVLEAFERRMDEIVRHPIFEYGASYRRTLEIQARLLARNLMGEIDQYPAFRTR